MNRRLFFLLLFFPAIQASAAISVQLAWDDSSDPAQIANYKMYGGSQTTAMNPLWTGTNKLCSISFNTLRGSYSFAVSSVSTAANGSLESPLSNMISVYGPYELVTRIENGSLIWDDPNPIGAIALYNVYGGSSLTNMTKIYSGTNKTYTISTTQGLNFFYVKAVSIPALGGIEGQQSNVVQIYKPYTLILRLIGAIPDGGTNEVIINLAK